MKNEKTLFIDDERAAVWLPFHNTFTRPTEKPSAWVQPGILIQLGAYEQGTTGEFAEVELTGQAGTKRYKRNEFFAMNIYAQDVQDGAGVQPVHYSRLWADYTQVDSNKLYQEQHKWVKQNKELRNLVRDKALHQNFKVTNLITCWPGKDGYQVTVDCRNKDHVQYTFSFRTAATLRVDLFEKEGSADPGAGTQIKYEKKVGDSVPTEITGATIKWSRREEGQPGNHQSPPFPIP